MAREIKGKYRKPIRDRRLDDLRMKRAQQKSADGLRSEIADLRDQIEDLTARLEKLEGT